MPEYRRPRIEGATYFFTAVTHRRQPVLCLPEGLVAMKDVFRKVADTRPFQIDAGVVLPDHLRCVWTMPRVGAKDVSPLRLPDKAIARERHGSWPRDPWIGIAAASRGGWPGVHTRRIGEVTARLCFPKVSLGSRGTCWWAQPTLRYYGTVNVRG
jgi:hypothetical protein